MNNKWLARCTLRQIDVFDGEIHWSWQENFESLNKAFREIEELYPNASMVSITNVVQQPRVSVSGQPLPSIYKIERKGQDVICYC